MQRNYFEEVKEQRPLILELANFGIKVEHVASVRQFMGTDEYRSIISILLKHLRRSYSNGTRTEIAHALISKEMGPHWGELVGLFEAESDFSLNGVKTQLGFALADIVSEDKFDEVVRLIDNDKNGSARIPLVYSLAKFESAKGTLEKILTKDSLATAATDALKKMESRQKRRAPAKKKE